MIQQTTKIICDNCGQGIYDFPENLTYKQITTVCRKKEIAVIRHKIGSRIPLIFCDEKCLKEYEEKYLKETNSKLIK